MFFAKQQSNKCGLHAIQNVLKTAAITSDDMKLACDSIHEKTGDSVSNHETFGGDWSVSAVLQTLRDHNFEVYRAVISKREREWSGPPLDTLMKDPLFKGLILHQPLNRHYTCIRPETIDDETHLYYVDSQSTGPKRISCRLALRRCLSKAYAWEPFVVKGEDLPFVPVPCAEPSPCIGRPQKRNKPSDEFLKEWRAFNQSR